MYEDKFPTFPQPSAALFFQEMIISMPSLLQGLHAMSLLKSVPNGLKPCECERTKLREPLPVPYVPTKDEVQEEVTKLRNLKIKTTIEKDTTLNLPVWHQNGTRKAFLMHVMAVLDAIKKRGHFKEYEKVDNVEATTAAESVEAGLALHNGSYTGLKKNCKEKDLAKAKEALAKAQETKSEAKEAEEAT